MSKETDEPRPRPGGFFLQGQGRVAQPLLNHHFASQFDDLVVEQQKAGRLFF